MANREYVLSSETTCDMPREYYKENGVNLLGLTYTINGRDYDSAADDSLSPKEFFQMIADGAMPKTSQVTIEQATASFEKLVKEGKDILHLAFSYGLSGTYQSAVAAAELCREEIPVEVVNSRTLCGPHRCLVQYAARQARQGASRAEILQQVEQRMRTEKSYLIPADFSYLRRGGRLSPLVSYVGQAVRFVPLLTLTEDSRQLTLAGVKRTFLQAVDFIARSFVAHGVGENWRITISHAGVPAQARQARALLSRIFPRAEIEILPLSPVFITQGGPGCVAIQTIRL